jgi:hypothetical protein
MVTSARLPEGNRPHEGIQAPGAACNDNGAYGGQLRDVRPGDGYSAKARFKEEDFNGIVFTTTSSAWQNYTYVEETPDPQTSYAGMQVYTDPAHRPDIYHANYGF